MTPRLLTVALLCLIGFPSLGQASDRYYARGVQEYFNGSSQHAEAYLSQAILRNHRDVRAYYFRGLAKMRQGRRHEAESDFRTGATIEAGWAGRPLNLGRSLQRVQGGDRLLLERIRREARKSRNAIQLADAQLRFQRTQDRGKEAMRAEFRFPLESLATTDSPDQLAGMVTAQANSPGNPFKDDPVAVTPTPVEIPDAARGAVTVDELGGLFGRLIGKMVPGVTVGGPSTTNLGGPVKIGADSANPFGPPTAAGGADPFGGPAGSDPFGGAPGPSDDPFGSDPLTPADDPFSSDAPASDDSSTDAPSDAPSDDPFGEDAGGAEAEDNPFG